MTCPHCGDPLPEKAAFCPACARSVNRRTPMEPPGVRRRKPLLIAAAVAAVFAVALGAFLLWPRPAAPETPGPLPDASAPEEPGPLSGVSAPEEPPYVPQVLEGDDENPAEVLYTDPDGRSWLVFLGYPQDRSSSARVPVPGEADQFYRSPCYLLVNDAFTGDDAQETFAELVASYAVEAVLPESGALEMVCSEPQWMDAFPGALRVSSVSMVFQEDCEAWVAWTLTMQNGDVIRLRQRRVFRVVQTWEFTPDNTPLDTSADLQALIDRITEEIPLEDVVNIHLPAVTYTEPIHIGKRLVNFYGSTEGEARTVFRGGVRVESYYNYIAYFFDLDFAGDGGTGLEATGRIFMDRCRFSGWDTAIFARIRGWVCFHRCELTDNGVGFHVALDLASVSSDTFEENVFRRNGTGILLESAAPDYTLTFLQTVFEENGKDIENLCSQSVYVTDRQGD